MALSAEDQRRIIEQESAWVDEGFGQLDLSSFPNLQEPPQEKPDPFANDLECGQPRASSSSLRQFVNTPDDEAVLRVAQESGNPDLLAEIRNERAGAVAREFKRRNSDYVASDENYDNIALVLANNLLGRSDLDTQKAVELLASRGEWNVSNIEAAWAALKREGLAELPAGTARELTEQERLHVIRIAQQGRVTDAIGQFLQYALDDEEPSLDVIYDPAYRQVCDRATLFCFEASQADYSPTAERREIFRRFAAGRPLTITLLQQAWAGCQRHEEIHARTEMLGSLQKPQDELLTDKALDALSDDAVDQLFHASLREYARGVKRAPGILA